MRILITGANGQLGRALRPLLAGHELLGIDLPDVDITDPAHIDAAFGDFVPELVIHCAAYTDVDGCARNPALANRVNSMGTQRVAQACQAVGAEMVHISTNEVFAGTRPEGYEEWYPLAPINAYGRSKAAAEHHVRSILPAHYIVRTAWLYAQGGRNFIHAILRRARETGELAVVTDEVANPTYVVDLAEAIVQLVGAGQHGTYHLTNAGAVSRWAFANEIIERAGLTGVVNRPILSASFERASSPPPFAELLNTNAAALGIELRSWQEALAAYLEHVESA